MKINILIILLILGFIFIPVTNIFSQEIIGFVLGNVDNMNEDQQDALPNTILF